jgi:two-component system, chemotaxis family, protein-glutamate methylesterase/glutaminase
MTPGGSTDDRFVVIALVASRGGIDAISTVLRALPAELPAAVIALLHIDPEHESDLPAIFARRCALPVATAEHLEPLRPRRVIVAPPGRHLLITGDCRTALVQSGAFPPSRPSADLLLTTLALAAGARGIAVVLSGGGHDGATGASAVHTFGGIVLATDEATSTSFSMPSATTERDETSTRVVPLEEIAPLLVTLAATPRSGLAP